MKRILFLPQVAAISLLGIAGCESYEMTVDGNLENCRVVSEPAPGLCPLVSEANGENFRRLDGEIVGFDFTWCRTHTLLVHDERQPDESDESRVLPVLDSVVESEFADGLRFPIRMRSGWQREAESPPLIPYHCANDESALCDGLNEALAGEFNEDGTVNETTMKAEFVCEQGNDSPRLVSFGPLEE